jgi:elongation factor G
MTDKLRNVCLLGHGGDGKTSLAESMLFLTKATDRLGKVSDGNTVCDFDPEEIKRGITIAGTPVPVEYAGHKFNVIDLPGYFDFAGEVVQGLRVAEGGIVVCTAKSGIGVGTEKGVKSLNTAKKARGFYVSKIDEENANFFKVYESLREKFGNTVCPVVIPAVDGEKTVGVIDLIAKKAYKAEGHKISEMPIPASMAGQVDSLIETLTEEVAGTSEAFMEKYLDTMELSPEELKTGVRAGVLTRSIAPVFCGCAYTGLGTDLLLQGIADYFPSPLDAAPEKGTDAGGNDVEVKADPSGPAAAFVFKTQADQYGKFSFFKVVSGKVTSDGLLINARTGQSEKIGRLFSVRGKKQTEVTEIHCGDIGAVAKLSDTKTGDTLCASGKVVALEGLQFAKPCYSLALSPKTKGGEEKIANGLNQLAEEDLTFTLFNNAETKQIVISGAGDIHIDVLCSKLKRLNGIEVETQAPRVPYREKIRKKVTVEGKHKKQSGGRGQFGVVMMELEPGEQEAFEFAERTFGGNPPRNFHPAVQKGFEECVLNGVLAGFPVVYLKATLTDGKHHDVDSSEMAFKLAARNAYRDGMPQASPVLLEPIGSLKVYIPDANMGDVIGDLNKRRGRVMGMNPADDGLQIVEAEVPMAEMSDYAIILRSMTQGRGYFELAFSRYEDAPAPVQQKVIEETKYVADSSED